MKDLKKRNYYAYVETNTCKKAWLDEDGVLYSDKNYAATFLNITLAKEAIKKAESFCNKFGNKLKRRVIVYEEKEIAV